MSAAAFEAFLARMYVDAKARAKFLADPRGEAAKAGLTASERAALENIDRVGLELAARSYARKRATVAHHARANALSVRQWWRWFQLKLWLNFLL